jgi:Carboxypeptidase regulatory-like domain
MTLLAIGAVSVMPTSFSGVLGHQGKLTYQPTGSEGKITGKVSFAGKLPQRKLIDSSADPVCQDANPELHTEDVIITAGNLANVFVYVKHPWERAYVAILSHPFFAVSARNGSYHISGLPPGQYVVVAWHERFGEQRSEISIGVGEQKSLDFTFKQAEN